MLPEGALREPAEVIGRVAAAALAPGEVATPNRFVGTELTASLVDAERPTMVPLKIADPTVVPLLHHGDTVTIITQRDEASPYQLVATGARVVVASPAKGHDPANLLVALPEPDAQRVAAASLTTPLAVVLTGDRAGNVAPAPEPARPLE